VRVPDSVLQTYCPSYSLTHATAQHQTDGSGNLQRRASLQPWKYFRYPLDSLGVPQRRCGRGGKQEKPFSCPKSNAGSPGHSCHSKDLALPRVMQQYISNPTVKSSKK